jgi:hypothetical protein
MYFPGDWDMLEKIVKQGQDALMAFHYSPKPVVSAPFGMVLGGGAEVTMAASRVCAAAESYIGQVEAGDFEIWDLHLARRDHHAARDAHIEPWIHLWAVRILRWSCK